MRIVFFFLSLFSFYTNSFAEKITIVTAESHPYVYKENGEIKGISTEVVKEIMKSVDVTYKVQIFPWARSFSLAKKKSHVLIYPLERTPERESDFHWVGTITPFQSVVYKLKKRNDVKITAVRDLLSYKVGVRRQGAGHDFLEMMKHKKLQPVKDLSFNIKKLVRDRIDLILTTEAEFKNYLLTHKQDKSLFEKVFEVDELSNDGYLAVSKQTPKKLVLQLRVALVRLKSSTKYSEIMKAYGLEN